MYWIGAPNTEGLLWFSLSLVMRLASNYNNKNLKSMRKILEFIKQSSTRAKKKIFDPNSSPNVIGNVKWNTNYSKK